MKLLAVLIAAVVVELPWGHDRLTQFDNMRNPANVIADGGGFDENEQWYASYRRSQWHTTLDEVEIVPLDGPDWFVSLQVERMVKGTRRIWGK